jgi:phage-related protein
MIMWTVETLNATVTAELSALPDDMLARLRRITELIQAHGIEQMREPHVKHLEGRLWEMRLTGRDGIARAIYMTASGRRVVILRAFVKKSRKTPRREIALALERAKEVQ